MESALTDQGEQRWSGFPYLQKPLSCVQRANLRPVEERGVIELPGGEDLTDVRGSSQGAVAH